MTGSRGSASMAALALLFFMAAVSAGGIMIVEAVLSNGTRSVRRDEARQALRKEGDRIVQALCADPTPEADSPLDPVWDAVRSPQQEGMTVALQDVSSALNANWTQKNIYQKTDLGAFLTPGQSADELQQRREDNGFSTDIASEYGDLIQAESLAKYFTGYGYANINVTDEFALRKLYAIRTGDQAAAEVFHTKVQTLFLQNAPLKRDGLRAFLGPDYDTLFPVMNVEPTLNVHFLDPAVMRDLLSYPDWKLPHPAQTADTILSERGTSELTAERLRQIIGAAEDNRIYQYFGVKTWFWRVTVSNGSGELELIVARLPPAESDAENAAAKFVVTEERYSP